VTTSTSNTNFRLYSLAKSRENPHLSICDAAATISSAAKSIEELKEYFRSVVDRGNLNFEYTSFITCLYDDELTEEYGIERFSDWEFFFVGGGGNDHPFIQYSLPELEGWMALLALGIAANINEDLKRPLVIMLERRYSVLNRLTSLYQKLAGEADWDYGPAGNQATHEYVHLWKAMHRKSLADEYFKYVNTDFQSQGLKLVKESESPISSAPSKGKLFPSNINIKNPHTALFVPLEGFLYQFEETDQLIEAFRQILDENGYEFDNLGKITCTYENEWMEREGISRFEDGECYVAVPDTVQNDLCIAYSKDEIEGWIALLALHLGRKRIKGRKEKIDNFLAGRFDSVKRIEKLREKLSGNAQWDFGPIGKNATSDSKQHWQQLHNEDLDKYLLQYAGSGFAGVTHENIHKLKPITPHINFIGGLTVGHNQNEFIAALENPFNLDPPVAAIKNDLVDPIYDHEGTVIGERVSYQLPMVEDGTVKRDNFNQILYLRENSTCVYYPDVISDKDFSKMSKTAGEIAYKNANKKYRRATSGSVIGETVTHNGLNFRVYLSNIDGAIAVKKIHVR